MHLSQGSDRSGVRVERSGSEKALGVKQTVWRLGLELHERLLQRNVVFFFSDRESGRNTNHSLIDVKALRTAVQPPPLDVRARGDGAERA